MWGKINDLEIKAPSSFTEKEEIIGGYNVTLAGSKRRYIKAVKKVWVLRYDILTTDEYDEIYQEFEKEIPDGMQTSQPYTIFTIYDGRNGVSNQHVHMEVSERQFLPGTDLLSSVEIIFTQV